MIKIFACIASASVVVAPMACSRPKDIVIAFDENKASQRAIENLNCTPAAGKACITEAREDGIWISHRLEEAFAREPECKGIRLAVDRDGKIRSEESLRGQVWTLSLDIRPRMDDHLYTVTGPRNMSCMGNGDPSTIARFMCEQARRNCIPDGWWW
jgi:hypothetical protein